MHSHDNLSEDFSTLLSDIKSEQLHWLWEKRIPRGKTSFMTRRSDKPSQI